MIDFYRDITILIVAAGVIGIAGIVGCAVIAGVALFLAGRGSK